MPPDPSVQVEAERWLRLTDDDLASARLHLATRLILPNQASFYLRGDYMRALTLAQIARFEVTVA